jgi:hypothetical protein
MLVLKITADEIKMHLTMGIGVFNMNETFEKQ